MNTENIIPEYNEDEFAEYISNIIKRNEIKSMQQLNGYYDTKRERAKELFRKLEQSEIDDICKEKSSIATSDQITALQSSLKEKEKECEVWKHSNTNAVELYKKSLQRIKELENTIYHERANNEQTLLVLSRKDAEIEALKERVSFLEGLAKKMFL